jgi:hypothetical protein
MLSFVDFYVGGTEDSGLLVCGIALLGKGFPFQSNALPSFSRVRWAPLFKLRNI